MSYTTVAHETWFHRLAKSIGSVGGGIVLFLGAMGLLFFNEGRAVRTEKSLTEGAGAVKTVAADKVDPAFEGKLVHLSGNATTADVLVDKDFAVSVNAVKLDRKVEMYQWEETKHVEEKKRLGGGVDKITTYDWKKTWSPTRIASEDFHGTPRDLRMHVNPEMTMTSEAQVAQHVTVGAFDLSPELIGMFTKPVTLAMTAAQVKAQPKSAHAKLDGTSLYFGGQPADPQIGDVRVGFTVTQPGPASIVGVQVGKTFAPWQAPSGDAILLLEPATKTAAEMFATAQANNTMMTWILRCLGWIMMFAGLRMVLKPLSVFADVLPFLGSVLDMGLGLFSFVTASALSTFIIAVSWLFFRPVMGVLLIAVAGGLGYVVVRRSKRRKQQGATTTAPSLADLGIPAAAAPSAAPPVPKIVPSAPPIPRSDRPSL